MSVGGGNRSLDGFLAEAQEIVEAFSKDLLDLGRSRDAGRAPNPETINALFRSAHSLKGLAGIFGVERLQSLAHAFEDLLDGLRMGRLELSQEVEGTLLDGVDVFTALISGAAGGGNESAAGAADRLRHRMAAASAPATPGAATDPLDSLLLGPEVRGVLTEYEEHRLRENAKSGLGLYRVRAAFELSTFDRGLSELSRKLKEVGEVISTLPAPQATDGSRIGFELIVGGAQDEGALRATVEALGADLLPVGRTAAAAPRESPVKPGSLSPPISEASQDGGGGATGEADAERLHRLVQTVRVDIRKLDRLMTVVGDLALAKTNLMAVAEALKAGESSAELSARLFREGRNFERRIDELQSGILDVRMVPLEQVFDKLARMLRKVARETGKEVDLRVSGGDVEIDKLIVEELSDPLMHLIRNAVDHGIESPKQRERDGKGRRGTLVLSAAQKGNHVIVELSDDGAGIDRRRVLEVAQQKGLVMADELSSLSSKDILNLLFLPGFSTARAVSSLSGRGVGLDVVKTNIATLSGLIDVESIEGRGTTFRITLPITLAILQALIVEAADRTYAVPLNSVLEIAAVREADIRTLEGQEVLNLRDTTLPLVRLERLFRLKKSSLAPSKRYVVVVGLAQERLGIVIDDLGGQQDIVIKPLGKVLGLVRGIAGATDLGDRRTVPVLDVAAIMEEAARGEPPERALA
ncbi:MAG: chemotaxis protein CheA [Deltaproteobacteria bacterium]